MKQLFFKLSLFLYLSFEHFFNLFPDIFIGNRLRRMFYKFYMKSIGKDVIINVFTHFEVPQKISIGNNCSFNRGCWISGGGGLQILDDVIMGPNVIIHTANHNYSNPNLPFRLQGHSFKSVLIKQNVWIGANAIILPGVTINENCIIGAGSVVTKEMPANSLIGGTPAKVIKKLYA